MKSYVFRVVLEPDEDVWRAFIPELEKQGAATWAKPGKKRCATYRRLHKW